MKNRFSNLFASRKSSFLPFEPTNRRIKVSLHQLVNDLLASLQPLTRNRNEVIHNGVPRGLCFIAEENVLAFSLWNLLGNALRTRQNEPIHVLALVDDHHTTISVKNAAHNFAISIPNSRLAR
jgi:signal transduction histidine kinase